MDVLIYILSVIFLTTSFGVVLVLARLRNT